MVTTHLAHNRQFEIFTLSDKPASEEMVDDIPLSSYFYQKYHIDLRYINLPCAAEKTPRKEGGTRFSYHPLELLKIIDGQRVSNSKCDKIVIFFS